jgi:hypothetical protein
LVLRLEESYRSWQRRDLAEEKIVYLYLDAIYPKVRSGGRVVSLAVLVALGVRENGEKVLLRLMFGRDKGLRVEQTRLTPESSAIRKLSERWGKTIAFWTLPCDPELLEAFAIVGSVLQVADSLFQIL